MNNTMTILFSFLILLVLTESQPRRQGRMGPSPAFNSKMEGNVDNNDLNDEVITRNLPYPRPFQPNLEESNWDNSGSYGSGESRIRNQNPFRPNLEEAHRRNRAPYNDFETNYNKQRSYEIGNFGNGPHNTNTFNIHKKIIYIN